MKVQNHKPLVVTLLGLGRLWVACRWVTVLSSAILLVGTAGAAERPFKGRIDGQFVARPMPNSTVYQSAAQAIGKSTHLGGFTKLTSDVFDIATGQVEGSFTMTAANGDHVTGVYSGFFVFGSEPGTFSWVLKATITGGSGRFTPATGNFVFTANGQDVIMADGEVHGSYTETFDGRIDY
jgi:hypothetical protein